MKRGIAGLGMAAALMLPGVAGAALIDRGYGLIYDDVLDITWLQDANYARTSGYDTDGAMTWSAAVAWADQLVYQGYDDWRLPTMVDTDTSGCNYAYSGTDCGYNVQTGDATTTVYSEMASLFYDTLGNLAYYDTSGNPGQTGWGLSNTGPFQNVQASFYWSGLERAPDSSSAWIFDFYFGGQLGYYTGYDFFAWAVRPGDVAAQAVPLPGSLALLGAALGVLGLGRRARRHSALR